MPTDRAAWPERLARALRRLAGMPDYLEDLRRRRRSRFPAGPTSSATLAGRYAGGQACSC